MRWEGPIHVMSVLQRFCSFNEVSGTKDDHVLRFLFGAVEDKRDPESLEN